MSGNLFFHFRPPLYCHCHTHATFWLPPVIEDIICGLPLTGLNWRTDLNFHDFRLRGLSQNGHCHNLHGKGDATQKQKHERDAIQYLGISEVPEEQSTDFQTQLHWKVTHLSSELSPGISSGGILSGLTNWVSSGFQITDPKPKPAMHTEPMSPARPGNHFMTAATDV